MVKATRRNSPKTSAQLLEEMVAEMSASVRIMSPKQLSGDRIAVLRSSTMLTREER
jgi:hypothetical protein